MSDRFQFDFIFDWPEWFRRSEFNWLNLRLIRIEVENERYLGAVRFQAIVLGLGFDVEWIYDAETRAATLGPIIALKDEYERAVEEKDS